MLRHLDLTVDNPFIEGALAGQQYSQSQQLFQYTKQEAQQKVAMNDFALQQAPITLKEAELTLKTKQLALDQQQAIMKSMASMGQGQQSTATDHATQLYNNVMQAAEIDRASGHLDDYVKHMKDASEILKNNSEIQARATTQADKVLNDGLMVIGSVPDTKAGWDQARQLFMTMHPDEINDPKMQQLFKMDWYPGMIGNISKGLTSAKDKAQIEKDRAQAVDAYAKARESDFMVKQVLPARVKLDEAEMDAKKKVGADRLNPTTSDVNEIVKMAEPHFPDAAGDPTSQAFLYTQSRAVAAQALKYEKIDGLSKVDAQNRAFREAYERKHYSGMPLKEQNELGTRSDKPLPAPDMPPAIASKSADDQMKWVKKNLKNGMFYATKKGVLVWDENANGFVKPEDARKPLDE